MCDLSILIIGHLKCWFIHSIWLCRPSAKWKWTLDTFPLKLSRLPPSAICVSRHVSDPELKILRPLWFVLFPQFLWSFSQGRAAVQRHRDLPGDGVDLSAHMGPKLPRFFILLELEPFALVEVKPQKILHNHVPKTGSNPGTRDNCFCPWLEMDYFFLSFLVS